MVNTKISALPTASVLGGTEQILAVQSGGDVNVTPNQLKTYVYSSPPLSIGGLVTQGANVTITGSGTSGSPYSISSSGGASDVIIVKDSPYNAVGNGTTDDTAAIQAAADACFGSSGAPHGSTNVTFNKQLHFPPGNYLISSPITFKYLHGAIVTGAGRFVTTITNNSGSGIFSTNGCGYSQFSSMYIHGNGSATMFNLDWDGTSTGYSAALQGNKFSDIYFQGGGIGVNIGSLGNQGSENLFLDCHWGSNNIAGIKTSNFNALQNTVVGGNFQQCNRGVWMSEGTVSVFNSGFQLSTTCDIQNDNWVYDAVCVHGCRTESVNFIVAQSGTAYSIAGCSQASGTAGVFLAANSAKFSIDSCWSVNGYIYTNASSGSIDGFYTANTAQVPPIFQGGSSNISVIDASWGSGNNLFDANTTYAMLPNPNCVAGTRGFIKDANVSTFGATVSSGGGANVIPIWSNGTSWIVG